MHPAAIYNESKAQLFSIYHKDGAMKAYSFLNNVLRDQLAYPSWCGLKAELDFYDKYRHKYMLDPIWDYGIKSDFSGDFDGCSHCRIDVTTNLDYKHLSDYDKVMRDSNRCYKIAVMNPQTGQLEDVYDLNFPLDSSGIGRAFDVALFMPADVDKDGCSKYNYYQRIVRIGSSDPTSDFRLIKDVTDWYIPDIHTFISDIPEDCDESYYKAELDEFLVGNAKFLSKVTGHHIVACGQRSYECLTPDGDGEYITKLYWTDPFIEDELESKIDCDISSELW